MLVAALAPTRAILGPVRLRQVVCQPGRRLTVAYDVDVRFPGDTFHKRLFVARSGGPFPAGTTVLADDSEELGVWLYPNDPYLPGLPILFDERRRAELLRQVGVVEAPRLVEARSYRPGRRAVVEIITDHHRLFVKAVRPHKVAELQQKHRALVERLPIPPSLGWSSEHGLVVLEGLVGPTLWSLLSEAEPILPPPNAILELLDLIPELDFPTNSVLARAPDHGRLLALLLPEQSARIDAILTALAQAPDEPGVPVHGDLHSAQLIVKNHGINGLLDVDSVGLGARSDDLAGLLAHVEAGASNAPYLQTLFEHFAKRVDPSGLKLRTAAALIGFASSPFVSQDPDWPTETARRIDRSAAWAGV